ncbi:MAG: hypothetical protein U9R60_12395 [Bacteroidota bacterium]|nr:hypothetical protein [Bacteroidota bacterium]
MIKKIAIPLLVPIILLQSCLGDPDPIPESIDTYHYYYNYLLESYSLQWEVDEVILGSGHAYGIPAEAIVTLDETEQEVLISSRNAENEHLIDSLSYTMFENGAYMIALLGTQEEPHLICDVMDTRVPSTGRVKFRFLHASEAMGPVDIYIGGDQPEYIALTNVDFTNVSEYLEATEEKLWTSVIVTPANSLPGDSTILEYTTNTIFQTGGIYLCVISHISNSNESPYQIQVDYQPVF